MTIEGGKTGTMGTNERPLLIIGASDQGEVVLDILRARAESAVEVLGFLDCDEAGGYVGQQVGSLPVLATLGQVAHYRDRIAGAIPAVGSAEVRERIAAELARHSIPMISAVHPTAILASGVEVSAGSVVGAGAILGVGVRVGRAAIVNTGAIVEHHGRIGDFAHVAPGARLAGGVRVGERAWVGLGACILEDRIVGADAEVGAGAVVTRDVAPGVTVTGVPARPLVRRDRDAELERGTDPETEMA